MEGEDVKVVASTTTNEQAFILSIPDDLPPSMRFSDDIVIEYIVRLTVGNFQSEQPVDVVAGTPTSRLSVIRSSKWQSSDVSSLSCCLFFKRGTCNITVSGESEILSPPCPVDYVVSVGGSARIDKLTVSIKYKCQVSSTGTLQVVPARSTIMVNYASTCFYRVREANEGPEETLIDVSLALPSPEDVDGTYKQYRRAAPNGTIVRGEYGVEIVAEYGCLGSEHTLWFPIKVSF